MRARPILVRLLVIDDPPARRVGGVADNVEAAKYYQKAADQGEVVQIETHIDSAGIQLYI
jgi:hypothetical protein